MIDLQLLSPEVATLLLLPKEERPKRSRERDYLAERVPFRLHGCAVRRARRFLPGDPEKRIAYLLIRPETRSEAGGGRVFLHPLLFALLLRRDRRLPHLDWGRYKAPLLPTALEPFRSQLSKEHPPGTIRSTALLAVARRRRSQLLLFLLLHLRLLPVLLQIEPKHKRLPPLLAPTVALLSTLLLLLMTQLGDPGVTVREPTRTAPHPPTREELSSAESKSPPALSSLSELLTLLANTPGEATIEEIEGTPRALFLSLRVADTDRARRLLREAYPRAELQVESSEWLLAEARGRILLTIPLK